MMICEKNLNMLWSRYVYEDSFTALLFIDVISMIAQGSREGSFSRIVEGTKRARIGTTRIRRIGKRIEGFG